MVKRQALEKIIKPWPGRGVGWVGSFCPFQSLKNTTKIAGLEHKLTFLNSKLEDYTNSGNDPLRQSAKYVLLGASVSGQILKLYFSFWSSVTMSSQSGAEHRCSESLLPDRDHGHFLRRLASYT